MNDQRFTFLCTKVERGQLTKLAIHYHRSQSDTIRLLIRQAIQNLSNKPDSGIEDRCKESKREDIHE
jgi:hypothetical protein